MRGSEEFATAIRAGVRSGSKRLVVHLLQDPETHSTEPVRVGFVVSKAVGNAVQRNLVRRRLRAMMSRELQMLSPGAQVVVRALPPAAGAGYAELQHDVHIGLGRAQDKARKDARMPAAGPSVDL